MAVSPHVISTVLIAYSRITLYYAEMYRRPKFLEVLLEIRQEMSRQSDYDVDLFAEMVRSDKFAKDEKQYDLSEPNGKNGKVKIEITAKSDLDI